MLALSSPLKLPAIHLPIDRGHRHVGARRAPQDAKLASGFAQAAQSRAASIGNSSCVETESLSAGLVQRPRVLPLGAGRVLSLGRGGTSRARGVLIARENGRQP